jgi:DNA-binding NtrC family response regulator
LPKRLDGFSAEALELLCAYNWPGNIRELENVVQRAVLLCKQPVIGIDQLPPALLSSASGLGPHGWSTAFTPGQTLREALEGPERQIILEVLRANAFSRSITADKLGINRTTLYKKMKKLGIDDLACKD